MPEGHDADAFRKVALENFDMSLGQGLGKVAGKVFRIGHLGDFNDLMLMGTLSGVEMALGLARRPPQARRRASRPHLPPRHRPRRPALITLVIGPRASCALMIEAHSYARMSAQDARGPMSMTSDPPPSRAAGTRGTSGR